MHALIQGKIKCTRAAGDILVLPVTQEQQLLRAYTSYCIYEHKHASFFPSGKAARHI